LLALSASVLEEVCEKLELSDEKCQLLADLVDVLCKKERRRSPYQAFLSKCLKTKGIKKFGEAKEALKACATEYREQKATGRVTLK